MHGHDPPNIISTILSGIVVLFLYSIGVFLHSKIISVSRKDKGMTWKFDIFNSYSVLFHYGHVIVMNGVTFIVKDISSYTGNWLCYFSKIIAMEGNIFVLKHSFIIAAMKYVIIVQYEWVREFGGNDKVKKMFFVLKMLYPSLVIGIFTLTRLDYIIALGSISHSNRCLGISDTVSQTDRNRSTSKMHHMCYYIEKPLDAWELEYAWYLVRKAICWTNWFIFYANMFNLIEAFIYFRIFSFMRRYQKF